MGNGTASAAEPGPVKLKDFSGVKSVSAGLAHTCIIDSKDDAYCWGQNDNGKLGYDSLEKSYTPVKVKDISNVSFIHAGRTASCLVSRGEVYCLAVINLMNYKQLQLKNLFSLLQRFLG
jgi:alpha-tubulin suppressor-like RCC1 family protein